MIYEVTGTLSDIELQPASEIAEILQNVRTIICTIKGTVPLDRSFGIDEDIIDLPVQIAEGKLSNEIFQAIKKYEPRVSVQSIAFTTEVNGKITPKVVIEL